jgi:hypothetical protein
MWYQVGLLTCGSPARISDYQVRYAEPCGNSHHMIRPVIVSSGVVRAWVNQTASARPFWRRGPLRVSVYRPKWMRRLSFPRQEQADGTTWRTFGSKLACRTERR